MWIVYYCPYCGKNHYYIKIPFTNKLLSKKCRYVPITTGERELLDKYE